LFFLPGEAIVTARNGGGYWRGDYIGSEIARKFTAEASPCFAAGVTATNSRRCWPPVSSV